MHGVGRSAFQQISYSEDAVVSVAGHFVVVLFGEEAVGLGYLDGGLLAGRFGVVGVCGVGWVNPTLQPLRQQRRQRLSHLQTQHRVHKVEIQRDIATGAHRMSNNFLVAWLLLEEVDYAEDYLFVDDSILDLGEFEDDWDEAGEVAFRFDGD